MQRHARCFHAIGAEGGAAIVSLHKVPWVVGIGWDAACWCVARFGHSSLAFPTHTHIHSNRHTQAHPQKKSRRSFCKCGSNNDMMNSAVSVLDNLQPGPLRFMLVVLAPALHFNQFE